MAEVLILSRAEMESLLTLEAIVPVIEKAFIAFNEGRTAAYPVVRELVEEHRGVFGIKSGYLMNEEVIGLKAGGFWLGNPDRGLTAHQSTTVMFDPRTGLPTAFMDGNHITGIRGRRGGRPWCRYRGHHDTGEGARDEKCGLGVGGQQDEGLAGSRGDGPEVALIDGQNALCAESLSRSDHTSIGVAEVEVSVGLDNRSHSAEVLERGEVQDERA